MVSLPDIGRGLRRGERQARGMEAMLAGRQRLLLFLGPAIMAATAYMDPGNVVVNLEAGSRYGYRLLWVVMAANVVAMLFQALSAKLGYVTGRNLAELCRDHMPWPAACAMWMLSEIAAMATDLAEFVGGAIGLMLLFHVPLLLAMAAAGAMTWLILLLDRAGAGRLEILIAAFVAVVGLCYLGQMLIAPVDWPAVAGGILVPRVDDQAALTLAVGIIGATVMPHALYLHSGLTQSRVALRKRRPQGDLSNLAVIAALTVAGAINLAMVVMAASCFQGHAGTLGIGEAYSLLGPLFGSGAAVLFLTAIIAAGLSSSAVGTIAGQIVMQGFTRRRLPLWLRRLVTMLPAFALIGAGVDATKALVLSQVVLSLILPLPMIMLILFTSRRDIMGSQVNSHATAALATVAAALVIGFNLLLLVRTV
ncbi:MAG TPA: Nramp family divalent metal transporter [Stellaceae bacterium]|nr:Nramp family divalent metal transporter [Stellaceae bacterium]